jgi:hypothetical protein
MTHEIFTLQCCDSIAPFNNYGQKNLSDGNDCMPRSVKVSQIINSDINFGMVYSFDPINASTYADSLGQWKSNYSLHAWNEKDGLLYESCRQWENQFSEELDTDQLVMMFDISHLQPLIKNIKGIKELYRSIEKRLKYAQSKGIKIVYFCGFAFRWNNDHTGIIFSDWESANKEFDNVEKQMDNFENGREVYQMYQK